MDVILHLGAHRTAATSFQQYMALACPAEMSFRGPDWLRRGGVGGLNGVPPCPRILRRARGRIALHLAQAERQDKTALLISDTSLIGPLRGNLRAAALYPAIGTRMARLADMFDGRITQVVLQIRSLEGYWTSVPTQAVMRGLAGADPEFTGRIASGARGWQDVLTDLSCAMPEARIVVTSFEGFAQRPDRLLGLMTGGTVPERPACGIWANPGPTAAQLHARLSALDMPLLDSLHRNTLWWQPFSPQQRHALRSRTAADLAWLRAGADGLVTFHERPMPEAAARAAGVSKTERGSQDNDSQDRHMARPCGEGIAGQIR